MFKANISRVNEDSVGWLNTRGKIYSLICQIQHVWPVAKKDYRLFLCK